MFRVLNPLEILQAEAKRDKKEKLDALSGPSLLPAPLSSTRLKTDRLRMRHPVSVGRVVRQRL